MEECVEEESRDELERGPAALTVKQAAERLRVSPGTVRNMIATGHLHAVRLHVRASSFPRGR